MIAVLNEQKDGFVKWLPGGLGVYPLHVGDKAVLPVAEEFVFAAPGQREIINMLLGQRGLKIGRRMGGYDYIIIPKDQKAEWSWPPRAYLDINVQGNDNR